MRTDLDPFKDKRSAGDRALSIDRPKLVQGLMKGKAQIGNDSPFGLGLSLDRSRRAAA
jgi:peptide/nickel transport system substrate-binding protein